MKKILSLLFVALMVISFAACEEDEDADVKLTLIQTGQTLDLTADDFEGKDGYSAYFRLVVGKDTKYEISIDDTTSSETVDFDAFLFIEEAKMKATDNYNDSVAEAMSTDDPEVLSINGDNYTTSENQTAEIYIEITIENTPIPDDLSCSVSYSIVN